ncbi:high mobility group box domain-containing protein [Phlebopus sp. FC_14]|nr:high mobility group box domain-containing protein [Phlebopus sp. FC_14]
MAAKPSKEEAPDVETTRSQFITKLSTAADAMRKFSTFADALAKVVAKVPLDDPELVQTLHAVVDAAPAPSRKRKLAVTDVADEGGKKRKREKKPKDPNAPKAPPSAYIMFQNDIRNAVREQHPDLQYKDLMGLISKQWNALPIEKKQASWLAPYFDKVNDAKKTHEIDLAKYNAQHNLAADEGPSKKVKKTVEVAEKPVKKAALAKAAKVTPKSAPTVDSSSEESDAESGSGASSDEKSGAKSEEEVEESSEEESSSEEDKRPSKKSKKSEKRK